VQRYAVIGKPVSHSLSPAMQQAAFDAVGIAATYEAIEASSQDPIVARMREQKFAGWNVTTPLKERVAEQVDELSEIARCVRAVNVVRRDGDRLVGHNTDGAGFVRAVEELWPARSLSGEVLVLGSGPTARAVALALRGAGAGALSCWARNPHRASDIAPPPHREPNLVVWAMPAQAVLPPEILALAEGAQLFFDCNYGETQRVLTPRGQASDGLPMLLHQGILSFEWWTGRPAPVEQMRTALAQAALRKH
jgi:shikimate dehydrogenase